MATDQAPRCICVVSAAALNQYAPVYSTSTVGPISAGGVAEYALQTAVGGKVEGIVQNKPGAAGQATTIAISGVTKAIVGAAGCAAGDLLMTDGSGNLVTYLTGVAIGTALQAGTSGQVITVLLQLME